MGDQVNLWQDHLAANGQIWTFKIKDKMVKSKGKDHESRYNGKGVQWEILQNVWT